MCCVFNDTATTEIYTDVHTLSLHDALPITTPARSDHPRGPARRGGQRRRHQLADRRGRQHCHRRPFRRSEEHTYELQSLMRISYAVFCLTTTKLTTQQKHT